MFSIEVIIDAITFSNLIIALAIGLTLTYMTLKVPNFAHGDTAVIGIYTAYTLTIMLGIHPYASMPIAFLLGGALSIITYILVYRVIGQKGGSITTLMIASIAVEVIIRSSLHIYADIMPKITSTFFRGFTFSKYDFSIPIGEATLPGVLIVSTLTITGIVVSLYLFLTRTKFGTAMRATIENPSLASTLGVDVEKVYLVSWFLAGGLAALSGIFLAFQIPSDPESGWGLLLRVFAASVLGGLDNIFGAVLGGAVIGFSEILGIYLLSKPPIGLSPAYRPAIPYLMFILVLLFAPKGITSINLKKLLGGEEKK